MQNNLHKLCPISGANDAEEKLSRPGIESMTSWLKDRHTTNFAKELSPLARAAITQDSHRTPYYTVYCQPDHDSVHISWTNIWHPNVAKVKG